MIVSTLQISNQMLHSLQVDAHLHPEMEICGILGGTIRKHCCIVDSIFKVRNISNEPHHHYKFEPSDYIHAYYDLISHNKRIVGIYHSHPSADTRLSETDLKEMSIFNIIYVVLSSKNDNYQAWYVDDDLVSEANILLME